MADVLKEAWLWLLLALLLGVVIGYFLRTYTVRETTTTDTSTTTRISELEAELAHTKTALDECHNASAQARPAKSAAVGTVRSTASPNRTRIAKPILDLAAAKAVLGTAVKLDDLKLVEGIGPKIDGLLKEAGITTWAQLSKASIKKLQGVLDAAGPRYQVHDPGSWPQQAGLLAEGKWDEFKTLTDSLKGGR